MLLSGLLIPLLILLHVVLDSGALGFDFLFAVYVVMEYVAVVGDFCAVLGGVDFGGADTPNGIEFFVDVAVDEESVWDVWITFDAVFYYLVLATHIIKERNAVLSAMADVSQTALYSTLKPTW